MDLIPIIQDFYAKNIGHIQRQGSLLALRIQTRVRSEFWPLRAYYLPVHIYCLCMSIPARSLAFFTVCNFHGPAGGLFPGGKSAIMDRIPSKYVPHTLLITVKDPEAVDYDALFARISNKGLGYPFVIKPDNGCNSRNVFIIQTAEQRHDLVERDFLNCNEPGDRLVQEFIAYEHEYGVFWVQLPGKEGKITGIAHKQLLFVYGDGESTLKQLVESHPRARFYRKKLAQKHKKYRDTVISEGEKYMLVSLGAHHMGSMFGDVSDQCTPKVYKQIQAMASQIDGFYYGRFDLKANSVQAIGEGDFSVIELNLTLSEPLQMYDPQWWYPRRIYELLRHWHYIYRISRHHHQQGHTYMSVVALRKHYQCYKRTGTACKDSSYS